MAKYKVGQKYVFGKCRKNKEFVNNEALTIGKIYEIVGYDIDNDPYFEDDDGIRRYPSLMLPGTYKLTKIVD